MKKVGYMKLCPLFYIKGEDVVCKRNGCMWFMPKNDDTQTPDECVITSINRNLLDIRLVVQEIGV